MEKLVRYLVEQGVLTTKQFTDAFLRVDRTDFVSPGDRKNAYVDQPLPIGFGQTISQPTVVAFMFELLQPQQGDNVLDVGSGSGWTTALLASIVGSTGKVWGVESITELVEFGRSNLAKYPFSWATISKASTVLGSPDHAPFDRIVVSAAGRLIPEELIDQLRVDGIMVMPVGSAVCQIRKTSSKKFDVEKFEGFRFVPLIPLS